MSERRDGGDYVDLAVEGGLRTRGFVARPPGPGPHPGLIVIQEAFGVNSQIRGVTARYAEQGFVAIAPDVFHRAAPGFEISTLDFERIMPLIKSLTTESLIADSRAAYDWLVAQPDVDRSKIAIVGFCLGGRAAYLANSELPLAASVAYYGGGIAGLLDRAPRLHGPQLFFWGGKDANITPEHTRAAVDALRAAGKPFVNVEFSDANHGFFNEQIPERYHPAAAAESWAMATRFLRDVMGLPG